MTLKKFINAFFMLCRDRIPAGSSFPLSIVIVSFISFITSCASIEEKKPLHSWLSQHDSGTILTVQNFKNFEKRQNSIADFTILGNDIKDTIVFRIPAMQLYQKEIEINPDNFKDNPEKYKKAIDGTFLTIVEIHFDLQNLSTYDSSSVRLNIRLDLYLYDFKNHKKIFWGTTLAEASSEYVKINPSLDFDAKVAQLFSSQLLENLRNRTVRQTIQLLDSIIS